MSWKNIKSFMIVLLFIACSVIGIMLLLGGDKEPYTQQSLEQSAKLMRDSGIIIDSELLLGDMDGMKVYRFSLSQSYPEQVAEALAFGTVTDVFTVPDGIEVHTDGGEKIFMGNDFTITYSCAESPASMDKGDFEALLLPKCESPRFGIQCRDSSSKEDSKVLTYVQTIGDLPIPTNTLTCTFSQGKLTSFSGKWCFPDKCTSLSAPLSDFLNIMFTERERILGDENIKTPLTVNSMEKCYGIENSEGKTSFLIVPSLLISYKEGEQAIHSAVAN